MQIIHVKSLSGKWRLSPTAPCLWAIVRGLLPKNLVEKVLKTITFLKWETMVSIINDKSCWQHVLVMWGDMKNTSSLVKNHTSSKTMRKIQYQTNPNWGTFYKISVQCFWKCQGHGKLGRLRNYHKPEATEETSQLTAM